MPQVIDVDVVLPALYAYKAETERYLLGYRSWPLTPPVDPSCCATCRREDASWRTGEASRKALQERLTAITEAITAYESLTETATSSLTSDGGLS